MAQVLTAVPSLSRSSIAAGACVKFTIPAYALVSITPEGGAAVWALAGTDTGAIGADKELIASGTYRELRLAERGCPSARTIDIYVDSASGTIPITVALTHP